MTLSALARHLRQVARHAADFVLPPTCGLCRAQVDTPGALCPSCWGSLSFIADPVCACCGLPFSLSAGPGALCAGCLVQRPLYQRARSVLVYDEVSRRLVSRLKYADQSHLVPVMAPWLCRVASELMPEVDVIIPVPLHWLRLWRRRYNQAMLLAAPLGRRYDRPVWTDRLQRRVATPPQVGLKRARRLANVRRAFRVKGRLDGLTVLLVDDVLTTGATLESCTRALLGAGAAAVHVLTLARVVRPGQLI